MIRPDDVVLFQGDSITACGRDTTVATPNVADGLGRGYVLHLAGALLAGAEDGGLKVYNRGVSGNRVADLAGRWQADCLDLQPTVVSILIGINDIVTCLGGEWGEPVDVEQYEHDYRQLLIATKRALPDARLVICETFSLPCGQVTPAWRPVCDARRATAARMAEEFSAVFVPLQQAFDRAVETVGTSVWSHDGVHPTVAGHYLMAECWRSAVGLACSPLVGRKRDKR